MIGSKLMMSIWPVLGIWFDKYQITDTITGSVVASPAIQRDYMTEEWKRLGHISEGEVQVSEV